ncbi:cytochrome b [Gynuella sp.]|uniref:cytochrome b n=1 Tax=Gynuella sp. TaxID=2969146 RepID=UPI003D1397B0
MAAKKHPLMVWIDQRLPVTSAYEKHMSKYYAPKNFNWWYVFGLLAMIVFANQILTGIWLTMSYVPSSEEAFRSVEYIMRDVEFGWLIRYMHSTGASMFFLVVYLHMFRGVLYGSYQKPRELIWLFGMFVYVAMMAEGFMGYILPWGNMSYWGAQVIISLFGAIPYIGEGLQQWIRGDYLISGITLNRFFALHVIALPLVLALLVVVHVLALHEVGSNNPEGIDIKKHLDKNGVPLDGVPFHPYFTLGKLPAVVIFLFVFCGIIFFYPEGGGFFLEHANFEPANNLKTPPHIAPVWYYGAFYAILRAIPSKLGGVIMMASAIAIMFVLPWLDRSPVKSWRYKGILSKLAIVLFAIAFCVLTYLGTAPATELNTLIARVSTAVYFAFFLLMPWYTKIEKTKPVPERVS